ncbi:MAG: outer membrane protein assembly factor BamD [Candidatus Omnitrophica bacterium]|nr:outer membrane protein assembly factor BamD [Candidatus Omnitrophota bacterium]
MLKLQYVFIFIFTLICPLIAGAQIPSLSEYELFSLASQQVQSGNLDFAFLYFNNLLEQFPSSRYSEQALFAVGEYYFIERNYRQATTTFLKFIDRYPDSVASVFALCYLREIAQYLGDESTTEKLTQLIISCQRLSLVFRESKTISYVSALKRKLCVRYFIDKVEFSINGELFARINY